MNGDEMLSEHFSLRELCRTQVRAPNVPNDDDVARLKVLCCAVLEPIRLVWGPLHVNSGYRCPYINRAIGGVIDSAHVYGCAADLEPMNAPDGTRARILEIAKWIKASDLPFDQVIAEHGGYSDWLHVGMLRPGHEKAPRREALIFVDGNYSIL